MLTSSIQCGNGCENKTKDKRANYFHSLILIVLEAGIKQVFKFQALVSMKLNLLAA